MSIALTLSASVNVARSSTTLPTSSVRGVSSGAVKVQLFGRRKALEMHVRRDEAHRVHRDAMGQQRQLGDVEVDACLQSGTPSRCPNRYCRRSPCSRSGAASAPAGLLPDQPRISSGSLPRVSRTNLSSLIRRRRGIRGQKADLLRRMVTRIPETIIFCHALNVSANKNNRTTRFHAGWVREQGWVPCAQGTPQGVKR